MAVGIGNISFIPTSQCSVQSRQSSQVYTQHSQAPSIKSADSGQLAACPVLIV
jgi:hypothetical protein